MTNENPDLSPQDKGVAMTTFQMALVLAQRAADDKKNRERERNTFRVIASLLRLVIQEEQEHDPTD